MSNAPTRILVNADVRTMNERDGRAEAIAWENGRIVAVGTRAEVERTAGPGAQCTDLGGATVLPGFIDAHHHPSIVALYGGVVRLVPPQVTDIRSLQEALAARAAVTEPGAWLVATNWDEHLLAEGRAPTRAELDDAVPDHPLFAMHYTCHRAATNSRGLELAGIGKDTPEPKGGAILRGKGGLPTGILVERAFCGVETLARRSLLARDPEGYLRRLARHYRTMAEAGITRVVDATVPPDVMALYRESARRGDLVVPTIMLPVSDASYLQEPWDVIGGALPEDGDDDLLTTGPIKLVFDGVPGCAMCLSWWQAFGATLRSFGLAVARGTWEPIRTALSLGPTLGADLKLRTGIRMYPTDEATHIVRAASERGFAVATHAIGNEAVEIAVAAYGATPLPAGQRSVRRLEHASFLDRELIRKIADVGAAVVCQPELLRLPTLSHAASIPGLRHVPLRWLLDAKVKVVGSSDHPVAGLDPLDGIRAAVDRRTARGHAHEPDQAIGLDEALVMYTRTAAEVCGVLDRCGTLEPGKRADLVILDGALTPETLPTARVASTVIGGAPLFSTR